MSDRLFSLVYDPDQTGVSRLLSLRIHIKSSVGSVRPHSLADRIHHQNFALPLGDLVQRQQRFVLRRQVKGPAHRRPNRRRDGPSLHGAARPADTNTIKTFNYFNK